MEKIEIVYMCVSKIWIYEEKLWYYTGMAGGLGVAYLHEENDISIPAIIMFDLNNYDIIFKL